MNSAILLGSGAFAREVTDWANQVGIDVVGYYSQYSTTSHLNDLPIWTNVNDIPSGCGWIVAVGDPKISKNLISDVESVGIYSHPPIIASPIGSRTLVGNGSVICPGSILTCDIKIGVGCVVNICCTIGHDVVVQNFSVISPNTSISGRVKIGNGCFIGTGVVVNPNITISRNTTIGSGAIVVKNILEENLVMVGNPARRLG